MKELRNLSNGITMARIALVPVLWVLALLKLSTAFAVLFAAAGLTDTLDGVIARKLKHQSRFGAWFDSFADKIVMVSLVFWLLLLIPDFFRANLWLILGLFALFILSIVFGFIKYRRMIHYHLLSSKVAAVLIYIFVVHALLFKPNIPLFYIGVVVIAFCIIEDIAITHINKKMPRR
jgi:CDP-diacylglycerol--glycerol-3-phosphate 3-phosphatidyltransferase